MKAPSLLVAFCLVLCSTLLTRATTAETSSSTPGPHGVIASAAPTFDCGGEPCDAVQRGLLGFFDRKPDSLDGNGRACADCHMPTDHFQLSPAGVEARFRLLQLRRRWNPNAVDPLFRPVDTDDFRTNGEAASDFSNLRFVGGPGPLDDWDKFDVPGLRGIRTTAPYFHNNSAATLEDVVDHYVQFFKRVEAIAAPGVVSPVGSTDGVHFDRIPRPEERAALLAYLRKL